MLFLYAETPFHPGASSSAGYVDLPVQRETHTGFPMFQASGLKGVLREAVKSKQDKKYADIVFGPDSADHAGCISVGDARILLFPVRSLKGVFAWVTCPMVLQRLLRDYNACFRKDVDLKIPAIAENEAHIHDKMSVLDVGNQQVILEEYEFKSVKDAEVDILANWLKANSFPKQPEYEAWRERLNPQLAIVSDDAFSTFVNFNTMVVNRTKLHNDRKVVVGGALWTEEHLPPDTLMYAPIFASKPRVDKDPSPDIDSAGKVLQWLSQKCEGRILAGGDETVGRGMLYARFNGGAE
jgi:CRISPR-associated protein Cmr4